MPNATLDTYTFDKTVANVLDPTALRAPNSITPSRRETWDVFEAASGYQEIVYRESAVSTIADKEQWELRWDAAPEATRAAVRVLSRKTATFSATFLGATRTVQTLPGEWSEEEATEYAFGALRFYNLKLTLSMP